MKSGNHKWVQLSWRSYLVSICFLLLLSGLSLAAGETNSERRLFFYNTHTHERLTVLREKDIERCFWQHGYEDVYKRHAHLTGRELEKLSPGKIIQAAVRKQSKPFLALSIAEAIAMENSAGIPPLLQKMIHTCVELARHSPGRLAQT